MNFGELTKKMIEFYSGNLHDINHFLKVYAYAKTIGECEGLDELTQMSVEAAAIVHDIACPLCREKYGHADGAHQEQEGPALTMRYCVSRSAKPVLLRPVSATTSGRKKRTRATRILIWAAQRRTIILSPRPGTPTKRRSTA